jgi:hypothetical protein
MSQPVEDISPETAAKIAAQSVTLTTDDSYPIETAPHPHPSRDRDRCAGSIFGHLET